MEYRPVGRGADTMFRTTGPWAVKSNCRAKTTPGISVCPRIGAAAAGAEAAAATSTVVKIRRIMTPPQSTRHRRVT